jgi:glucose-6-phosphate 1-epimerase
MAVNAAEALNERFAIPDQVGFRSGPGGLLFARIQNERAEAEISLQGGQVLSFVPRGAEPLIFTSAQAVFAPGKAIRGGIPVCWPWFGPHPTNSRLPQHGFARTAGWTVLQTTTLRDGTTELRLGLRDSADTHALWPQTFELTLEVRVGRRLRLVLQSLNTGDRPFEVSEALHSYLQISDVSTLRIHGLDGTEYIDKVDGGVRKVQQGAVTIEGETDKVYVDTTNACVVEDGIRRIRIEKEGSRSTVVWNPWREKARQMADFGDEEYSRMVCVEAANALDNTITVEPGASHRLAITVGIEPD